MEAQQQAPIQGVYKQHFTDGATTAIPDRGIKEGDLRDGGSLANRASKVTYWHQWPDEYDHLMMKWDEFLSA